MNDLLYKIRVQMKRNDISEDEMQYLSSNYEVLINFEKNYQKGNTNLTNYTTH